MTKGKLESTFPSAMGAGAGGGGRLTEIIVFMVGGATFEEATKVRARESTGLDLAPIRAHLPVLLM